MFPLMLGLPPLLQGNPSTALGRSMMVAKLVVASRVTPEMGMVRPQEDREGREVEWINSGEVMGMPAGILRKAAHPRDSR